MFFLGDPTTAMEAVAKIAAEPFVAGSAENVHIVENPAGHMTLKRLIQNDQDRIKNGKKGEYCLIASIFNSNGGPRRGSGGSLEPSYPRPAFKYRMKMK